MTDLSEVSEFAERLKRAREEADGEDDSWTKDLPEYAPVPEGEKRLAVMIPKRQARKELEDDVEEDQTEEPEEEAEEQEPEEDNEQESAD